MSDQNYLTISSIVQSANNWLLNSALPIWIDKGIDWSRGGFFEELDLRDFSCAADYKRVRVLARQIYVFSVACDYGVSNARKAVAQGLEFLINKHRLPEGGFASRVTLQGDIIEAPLDLYDLSFCLFALAHGYKLLGDGRLKEEALYLTQFILDRFRHSAGGFKESLLDTNPRRQNPHMHLFEALIEWQLLSDNPLFYQISNEIITLFFDKFYCSDIGALIEYFDDNLFPACGHLGQITEPGHHFEWVWLLNRYKYISDCDLCDYTKLYQFANLYGLNNNTRLLWGEVSLDGSPVASLVRLWPHTEWIKAELVINDAATLSDRVSTAWLALSRFFDCPQPGLWYEIFDHQTNKFLDTPAPASSLYHIVLAIEALNSHVQPLKPHHE